MYIYIFFFKCIFAKPLPPPIGVIRYQLFDPLGLAVQYFAKVSLLPAKSMQSVLEVPCQGVFV